MVTDHVNVLTEIIPDLTKAATPIHACAYITRAHTPPSFSILSCFHQGICHRWKWICLSPCSCLPPPPLEFRAPEGRTPAGPVHHRIVYP